MVSTQTHLTKPAYQITRKMAWTDRAGMMALCLVVSVVYVHSYWIHPARPHVNGGAGWSNWFDQSWYFRSAKAWATGDLNPNLHFYLPGYPLLGAILYPAFSVHAFAVIDLLCLLMSMWLFSRIAVHLLPPNLPHASLAGGIVFALTTVGSPAMREIWVVPWSSSGSTPFIYAALLSALRFVEAPQRPGRVFWVGLAGGAIAAFRPSDMMPIAIASLLGIGLALLRAQASRLRLAVASIGAGTVGLAIALGSLGATYAAIYGLHKSQYVQLSAAIGFEWRSLLLHWVTLGLNPRPLYDEGQGMISAFPWLPLGLAVFPVYVLVFCGSTRWVAQVVIVTATLLHMMIYLSFRDLYPEGLFLFENYHYYKWVIPIYSLYCLMFSCDMVFASSRQRALALSFLIVDLCLLLSWRAQFTDVRVMARNPVADPAHMLAFNSGLTSVNDAILVSADGSWAALYGGNSSLIVDGHSYTERLDYKIHPALGGFFLVPLRPLPEGPTTLTVDPLVTLDSVVPLLHAKQSIVFGWPCWIPGSWKACAPQSLILPPELPSTGELPLNPASNTFLFGGWSAPQATGRWTDGTEAALRVRPPKVASLKLDMTLAAFVPLASRPLSTTISVDSEVISRRTFLNGLPTEWQTVIPARLIAAHPTLVVVITIDNPRRPADFDPHSLDHRQLGLFFSAIRLYP